MVSWHSALRSPPPLNPRPATCEYLGQVYSAGSRFRAADGCNTCTCGLDGVVGCTLMGCTCTGTEAWRQYMANTPAQCAVIDFACPANTSYFADACGCGCQQDPNCPEVFACADMSSPCNPPGLVRCPLTPVAA
jgi:hypothetical protein